MSLTPEEQFDQQYSQLWLDGESKAVRDVVASTAEIPGETAPTYLARVLAVLAQLPTPIDGPILINMLTGGETPLIINLIRSRLPGYESEPDYFNRGGSIPLAKVAMAADGSVDYSAAGMVATIANLESVEPVQPEFKPSTLPFMWRAWGDPTGGNGIGAAFHPNQDGQYPVDATYVVKAADAAILPKSPAVGAVLTLQAVQSGTQGGNSVQLWVVTSVPGS